MTELIQPETTFWNNILLLGFDVTATWEKYKCKCEPSMFRQGNTKGMEIALYFLFTRLEPKETAEAFRGIFPVFDKTQARDFKKRAFDRLTQIESEGHLPRGTVKSSYLQGAGGERFIIMMWRFSSFVLRSVFQRDAPEEFAALPSFTDVDAKSPHLSAVAHGMKLHIAREARTCLHEVRQLQQRQERWAAAATGLTQQFRDLAQQEKALQEAAKRFERRVDPSVFSEMSTLERTRRLDSVRAMFESADAVARTVERHKVTLEGSMFERPDQPCLTADALRVTPPATTPTRFDPDLAQRVRVAGSSETVDLVQLTKVWTAAVKTLQRAFGVFDGLPLASSNLPPMNDRLDGVETLSREQQSNVAAMHSIRTELNLEIPRMQERVEQLDMEASHATAVLHRLQKEQQAQQLQTPSRRQVGFTATPATARATSSYLPAGLSAFAPMSLVPPTPAAAYAPRYDDVGQESPSASPFAGMPKTPGPSATQAAIERLEKSVWRGVRGATAAEQALLGTAPAIPSPPAVSSLPSSRRLNFDLQDSEQVGQFVAPAAFASSAVAAGGAARSTGQGQSQQLSSRVSVTKGTAAAARASQTRQSTSSTRAATAASATEPRSSVASVRASTTSKTSQAHQQPQRQQQQHLTGGVRGSKSSIPRASTTSIGAGISNAAAAAAVSAPSAPAAPSDSDTGASIVADSDDTDTEQTDALDALADQIAEAMVESGATAQEFDVIGAISADAAAFGPKRELPRTPAATSLQRFSSAERALERKQAGSLSPDVGTTPRSARSHKHAVISPIATEIVVGATGTDADAHTVPLRLLETHSHLRSPPAPLSPQPGSVHLPMLERALHKSPAQRLQQEELGIHSQTEGSDADVSGTDVATGFAPRADHGDTGSDSGRSDPHELSVLRASQASVLSGILDDQDDDRLARSTSAFMLRPADVGSLRDSFSLQRSPVHIPTRSSQQQSPSALSRSPAVPDSAQSLGAFEPYDLGEAPLPAALSLSSSLRDEERFTVGAPVEVLPETSVVSPAKAHVTVTKHSPSPRSSSGSVAPAAGAARSLDFRAAPRMAGLSGSERSPAVRATYERQRDEYGDGTFLTRVPVGDSVTSLHQHSL